MPTSRQCRPIPERFWEKVIKREGGCWEWQAKRNQYGYGKFSISRRSEVFAHRLSWELMRGPIPAGLVIDHLCRNPACVNPDHLEPVTQMENVRRGEHVTKNQCVNGHTLTPDNLYFRKNGARRCRVCAAERRQSMRDGIAPPASYRREVSRLTHCKRGHAFDEANTLVSSGVRYCRTCVYARSRAYRERKAAVA